MLLIGKSYKGMEPNMDQKINMYTNKGIEILIEAGDYQQLNEIRQFLFSENCRLQEKESLLDEQLAKLEEERRNFRSQMDEIAAEFERKQEQLRKDRLFFDQKMKILKEGFDKLNQDKKQLELERSFLAEDQRYMDEQAADAIDFFFKGADTEDALKKRYRDLMKIFHPDNESGDSQLMQMINIEYSKLSGSYVG